MYLIQWALLFILFAMTGCASKLAIAPIRGDLKPAVKLAGNIHVMPAVDAANILKTKDGSYSLSSGTVATDYFSEVHPVRVIGDTVDNCLAQTGLKVTTGSEVPADVEIVVQPTVQNVYAGTHYPFWAASFVLAVTTRWVHAGSYPNAALVINNSIEDRKNGVKTDQLFKEVEYYGASLTKSGGVERAFGKVQEKYCSWLQKQIADLQSHKMTQVQK